MRILFFVLLLLKCACPLKVDALHSEGADVVGPGKEPGLGARHAALARALKVHPGKPSEIDNRLPEPKCSEAVKMCTTKEGEPDCSVLKKKTKLVECAKEFLPIYRAQKEAFNKSKERAKIFFTREPPEGIKFMKYSKGERGVEEMKRVLNAAKLIMGGLTKLLDELKKYWTEFVLPVKDYYDLCSRCQKLYGKFHELDKSSP